MTFDNLPHHDRLRLLAETAQAATAKPIRMYLSGNHDVLNLSG